MNIDTYKIELGEVVNKKVEQAFNELGPMYLYEKEQKLKLYIPNIAMDYWVEYLNSTINFKYSKEGINKYKGVEILQGYEMAIILVHDSYTIYLKSDSISRVKL